MIGATQYRIIVPLRASGFIKGKSQLSRWRFIVRGLTGCDEIVDSRDT